MEWENPVTTWGQAGKTVPVAGDFNRIEGNTQYLKDEVDSHKADYTLQVPFGGTTTNSGNNYSIATPAISSLTAGMAIAVKINADSTGACTLNWNGKGAKPIKKANGADVTNLKAGGIYTLRYDGANFILQGEGASGNATASDLLSGKTATTDAGEIVGTIPLKGAQTYTPGTTNQVISAGQYLSGAQTILGDANLVAGNILSGKSIFGVAGSFKPPELAGINWTQRTSSFDGSSILDVAYGQGMFVAVGGGIKLATSTDGITWTQRTVSGFDTNYNSINGVTYGQGMFVVVGGYGELATSTDGINWTLRTSPFDRTYLNGVAYGQGMFVVVGSDGKLATSTNGINWTLRTSSFGTTSIAGVTYGQGMFVAVGYDGKLATSTDGITWTQRTSSFGTSNILGVTYGQGMFVAVGGDGKLATSTNGTSWTQRTSSFGTTGVPTIWDVAYGQGMFVAGGNGGKLATSTDGINWTQRTSGFGTYSINGVTYGQGMFVAVGGVGYGDKLATSTNKY